MTIFDISQVRRDICQQKLISIPAINQKFNDKIKSWMFLKRYRNDLLSCFRYFSSLQVCFFTKNPFQIKKQEFVDSWKGNSLKHWHGIQYSCHSLVSPSPFTPWSWSPSPKCIALLENCCADCRLNFLKPTRWNFRHSLSRITSRPDHHRSY